MTQFELGVWVTRDFARGFTHVVEGSFVDPQSATQGATDLFCYDRNSGVGAFFATVKSGRLDDGTVVADGPKQMGGNHTFDRRWTHVVYLPLPEIIKKLPFVDDIVINVPDLMLFYDASTGVGDFNEIDGKGGMFLKKRHTGWRTSWTHIVAGAFGKANLLFYDAAGGVGEFYKVESSGEMRLIKTYSGWRSSWHKILAGNFSDSRNDDLLFYDKSSGVGEFYRLDGQTGMQQLALHEDWRGSWHHIVAGSFEQNGRFDSLLFFEENTFFTEFYATNGHGGISQIPVDPGSQWRLPWHTILAGQFAPNMGLIGSESLCAYHADGSIRYFFLQPGQTKTVFDLNGAWRADANHNAVISTSFDAVTVDMSAFNRPAAHGAILDNSTIRVTFPDELTHTAKLEAPNRLRWSNGSAWVKA